MDDQSDVMEFAPWSPSKLDLALDCGYAFNQKYVLKDPGVDPAKMDSTVGTVVHRILQTALLCGSVDKAYKEALEGVALPYEAELQAQTYRDAVKEFVKGMEEYKKTFAVNTFYAEKQAAISKNFELTGYGKPDAMIRGAMDLLLFTEQPAKCAVIIDHKTGVQKDIDNYDSQILTYSLFAEAMRKDLTKVQFGIHYVGADPNVKGKRTVWAEPYYIQDIRTKVREKMLGLLQQATKSAHEKIPHKSWRCNYCNYIQTCPLQ